MQSNVEEQRQSGYYAAYITVPQGDVQSEQFFQLADIARLTGVSTSTASRALSNNPLVKQATRDRISEMARSLNYTVNIGAKSLRLRQNTTVGLQDLFMKRTAGT